MKVFFVKYNDPIYVKLEKLDIMIRLTNQANIANVLAELKEYATEVDVDFVRKSVRAIGRCAIKVEPAAERCVSTLLDLIQTKVNYVVQEAIVVIKVQLEHGLMLSSRWIALKQLTISLDLSSIDS